MGSLKFLPWLAQTAILPISTSQEARIYRLEPLYLASFRYFEDNVISLFFVFSSAVV
jgi:hypothetical protein